MAEILSAASGVAGLVGLSGQILQGCLSVKRFFEDAKTAPRDVTRILKELEIFEAAIEKTKLLFEEVNGSHAAINQQYFEPSLKECLEIITRIGNKLAEISRKLKTQNPSRWWEMMKVAARSKVINGQLVCLERAKSSLQIVQQNIKIALQSQSQTSLKEATSSISSIQAAATDTATKVDQVLEHENNLMAVSQKIDQNVATMSTGLQEIRSQIVSQGSTMATAEMANQIYTKSNSILDTAQDIRSQMATAEMANEISTQGSAILATSQETHSLAASTSADVKEALSELHSLKTFLVGQQEQRLQEAIKSFLKPAISEALAEHYSELKGSEKSDEPRAKPVDFSSSQLWSTEGRQVRRRSRVHFKSTYNTGLFKIYVKTVEHLFDTVYPNSTSPRSGRRLITTYEFVPNTLFLSRRFILDYSSSSKFGMLSMQLQTINVVPYDAQIFEACKALNVAEVQRLFSCGLASPSDRNADGWSLLDIACLSLHYSQDEDKENFQNLIRFFIDHGGQSIMVNKSWTISRVIRLSLIQDPCHSSWWTSVLQSLLPLSSADPFEDPRFNESLTLAACQHPVYDYICQQDFWYAEFNEPYSQVTNSTLTEGFIFQETDRHIASDVYGVKLKKALLDGSFYEVMENQTVWHYWNDYQNDRPLNTLVRLMAKTTRFDVREGCRNRLVLLLQHGYDPSAVEYPKYIPYEEQERYDGRLLSPTQVAQALGLDYSELWYNILLEAGMTLGKVIDIFDTELYAGIPELLDQTRPFVSRDECGKKFLENLVTGKFVSLSEDDIWNEIALLIFNLGIQNQYVSYWKLVHMVLEANTSFKRKFLLPGSWVPDCEEEIRLVPGVDFCWPVDDEIYSSKLNEWVSWEELLTGAVTL